MEWFNMHLYLVRHGESHINFPSEGTRSGDELDAGLTDNGRRQAQAAARWLKQHLPQIKALYISPMKRALETAQFLVDAYQCSPILDDRLREIGNNRIDHSPLPNHELPNKYSSLSSYQFPFSPVAPTVEQGESFMHYRVRLGMFLEDMIKRHSEETVIIVGHGGTVNGLSDTIFNVGPYRQCDIRGTYTGITYFQYMGKREHETWRLHYLGRVDHLVNLYDT
jgi:probable phosphoglycerate mutase